MSQEKVVFPAQWKFKMRVIWSVDPYAGDLATQRASLRAILALPRKQPLEIEPVFVQNFDPITPEARKRVEKMIGRQRQAEFLPLKVVQAEGEFQDSMVQALLGHARKTGAHLIVAGTHARKGFPRLVLGSFAEALSLKSDLPLLIVNPKWKGDSAFRSIFFATDFSQASRSAYEKAISLARKLGCRMTIYHKLLFERTPRVKAAIAVFPSMKKAYESEKKARAIDLKDWISFAARQGVKAQGVIDIEPNESMTKSILSHARKKGALIALAGQSGPITASLLGSTVRNVLRASAHPVWVIHSGGNEGWPAVSDSTLI